MVWTENPLFHIVLLTWSSSFPFIPGLSDQFIFDDSPAILNNKGLQSSNPISLISLDYWGENMSSSSSHKSYRPLTSFTFWIQAQQHRSVKESARSMKIVNIMLNCLVTLSAYAFLPELVKLCKQQYNKLFILSTCLLFSLHPVHTEPVISIVGRADLLAALFFIVTCLFTLWFNPDSFIGIVFKHFIISLLSFVSMLCYSLLYHIGLTTLTKHVKTKLVYVFHTILLILILLRTCIRSSAWRQENILYRTGLTVCPGNGKVHYNIAKILDQENKRSQAILFYSEAVRLEPDYIQALNNLGNLLKDERRYKDAEYFLRRAIRVNNQFAAAYMNLGIVLERQGEVVESEYKYLQALQLRTPYPDCEFNLGNLYLKTMQFTKAEMQFRKGVELNHELSYINLSLLLDQLGKLEESRQVAEQGLDLFPRNPQLHFHLANSLGKLKMFIKSEKEYKAALHIVEKSSFYLNLGVLYNRWGKLNEARDAYASALRLEPGNINARKYLNKIEQT
ncbi:transmembrane and TPR repeat-containing protein 4 [Eurytemora carolleeae]|uniref:transmembrane and TPR repeat-containing protein 4 n=1 Tax=Eurytemora carolleeae TaxID=1294199 RepID=UPI000C75E097|nr:transmembrane and TPR repeat-containing protein 4 [Eurytemora carolleeae]|eukprot:XP_023347682.1 transmembrane and TPR repeat-containing protein 4-like [Eurytemora affinis]